MAHGHATVKETWHALQKLLDKIIVYEPTITSNCKPQEKYKSTIQERRASQVTNRHLSKYGE